MRTLEQIRAEILTAKAAEPLLNSLDSPSATAIWRLWVNVVAYVEWLQEGLWERYQATIEAIIASQKAGTAGWYVNRALEFRFGGTLSVVDGQIAQTGGALLVTRAAMTEPAGGLPTLKLAKGATPATLGPLTGTELVAFESYLERVKFAGVQILVSSLNADALRLFANIYYEGQLDPAVVKAACVAALRNYLAALPFDGSILRSGLQDALQAVAGVKDVELTAVAIRPGGGAAVVPVGRIVVTAAGYAREDTMPGQSFNDTLTLIPTP